MRYFIVMSCLMLPYMVMAQATIHPIDREIDACLGKNITVLGMMDCHTEGLKAWESEMNKVYNQVVAKITGDETKMMLKEQQAAWRQMTTLEHLLNEKIYGSTMGTNGLLLASSSRTDAVRMRTQKLLEYLDLLEKKPIK